MRKIVFLLIIGIIFTTGCAAKSTANNGTGTKQTTESPTGYPTGELQQEYLFYNGTLYVSSDKVSPANSEEDVLALYEGYESVGEIKTISNVDYPDSEFEGSHFSNGDKIYALDDKVVVFTGSSVTEMKKSE